VNEAHEIDAIGCLGTFIIFEYTNTIKEACLLIAEQLNLLKAEINISAFCYFGRNVAWA